MKIRTQLTLAIVFFGIALLIIAGSFIITNQQVDRLNNQQALAKNIEIEANELGYLSSDYILYRESQQAERWESKYSALDYDIRGLVVDTPGQQVLVDNLMENRDRLKNVFDDVKSGFGSTPQNDPASDLLVIQISWSRLAVQTQGVVFDAGRLSEMLHDESEQVMRLGNILIFLLMGTFSLFIFTSYLIVYRRTLASIAGLQEGAKIIGSGNLDHTIPERGDDEISDLSRAFNRMTAELKGVTASKTDLEREVAERRRAEEEVGERNEELEVMNEELTAAQEELQTANTDLAAHEQNLIRKNTDLNALNEELVSTQDELHGNIRELTRARDEVRSISEQLQVALDAAKLGWWHYDPVTRKSRFDQRYREIFSVSGEEMPNDEILATRIYPDDLPGLWAKVEAALNPKNPQPYSAEYRINLPDGTIRWIEAHGLVLFTGSGVDRHAKDFVGTVADITDRREAAELLRVSEERLRSLYASMTEGVAIHEITRDVSGRVSDYRITEVNPSFSIITGIPQEQSVGALASALYGTGKPPYLAIYSRVAESGTPEEFDTEFAPMAKVFHISVFSPAKGTFVTVFSDITERKRAEEALRGAHDELELRVQERTAELKQALEAIGTERHRLYDVLETLPVYVCLLDKDYRMPFANKYFRETFGYSDRLCCHKFLFNLEKPCDNCDSFTVMKTKAPHHWYWTGPNGRNYDIYDFPFYDEQGSLLILEMGIDITEQKKAEDALIKSRDELEVRVQERTADLARKNIDLFAANEQLGAMNEELSAAQEELQQNIDELGRSEQVLRQSEAELKEALEEKEVLLSEIHHRVKNNLAAFISLISLESTYEDTPEGQALKKDLQNRARSMALIHETLYRTRKYSSVDMDIYLNTLVDQIAASYSTTKFVRTIVEADDTLLDLSRATPCGLIINELVTNSFKYAFPDTFDCIDVRKESCTIRISLHNTDGFYLLSVSDNGIGLPPGFDITTTQTLGLKLVNFLAKHQLRAKVSVAVNEGTVFTIRFGEAGK